MLTSPIREIVFSKFQGAGNDFIIINDLRKEFPLHDALLVRRLCDRQLGVGADGLILFQDSVSADYKMRIFNKDGVEASMCGNGLRCLARHLFMQFQIRSSLRIESARGVHLCHLDGDSITSELGIPLIRSLSIPLAGGYCGHIIDTGVPHAVIFVDKLDDAAFVTKSREIRYQREFAPEGVNVNFAFRAPQGEILLRTYERGVEEETLACGTGAAAAAVALYSIYRVESPIEVVCKSKERLLCFLEGGAEKIIKLSLKGPARHVFHGKVALDLL